MSGQDSVRIHINHDRREGYSPSIDGREIKEELSLREFLSRIFEDRHVENEIYRVSRAVSSHDHRELEMICDKYNEMYIHVLRSGKVVLPQHKMSGIGGLAGGLGQLSGYDRMERQQAERQQLMRQQAMSQDMGFRAPAFGVDPIHDGKKAAERKKREEKKKRDDDFYYLLT